MPKDEIEEEWAGVDPLPGTVRYDRGNFQNLCETEMGDASVDASVDASRKKFPAELADARPSHDALHTGFGADLVLCCCLICKCHSKFNIRHHSTSSTFLECNSHLFTYFVYHVREILHEAGVAHTTGMATGSCHSCNNVSLSSAASIPQTYDQ